MSGITLPLAALLAGAISFSSPCCLPLVPSYLSFVSGLPVSELTAGAQKREATRAALLFVGGFTLVFTALGASAAIDLGRFARGRASAFGVGMAFAFGWVPCIGPVLATLLAIAATSETAGWGAMLLALYSLGLGLPFIVLARVYGQARGSLGWLRRNSRRIETVGGVMLVIAGVLFVTGMWLRLFIPMQREFARLGWPPV